MTKRRTGLLLAAGLVAGFFVPGLKAVPAAHGQSVCAARSEFVAQLAADYGEGLAARGLAENGWLLEIFASVSGERTWTVLITRPSGIACVTALGSDFEVLPPPQQHREGPL